MHTEKYLKTRLMSKTMQRTRLNVRLYNSLSQGFVGNGVQGMLIIFPILFFNSEFICIHASAEM